MRRFFKSPSFLPPFFVLIVCLLQAGCGQNSAKKGIAPDFTLSDLNGKSVNLAELAAQGPVLIAFWATWCPPCLQEIPILNEIQAAYGDKGLKILGVNVQERAEVIENFIKQVPISYTVLLDDQGTAASDYNLNALPVVVLLAKGGEIIYYGYTLPDVHKYMEDVSK